VEAEIEIIQPKKRNWKRLFLVAFILLLGSSIAFFGARAYTLTKQIVVSRSTNASPLLSGDSNILGDNLEVGDRRINILLLGQGGENHPGGNLTDTMLVASVDTKNKEVSMLSVPRDLHIKVEGFGYQKINSVLSLGTSNPKDDDYKKYELVKNTVSNFLGVPIHYFALVNFDGFKEIIDIIGGVDVYVEEDFYDPYFPDANVEGYDPLFVEKGLNHMDGAAALKYARSRETTSDFDRSRRQQEIIVAVKNKILEKESYTSASKISQIINILKDNLKTDMQLSEIEQLLKLTKGISKDKIYKKVLDDSAGGLLYADNLEGMYVLSPIDPSLKQVHAFVKQYFRDPFIVSENSRLSITDGAGNKNAVKDLKEKLNSVGFTVADSNNQDEKKYTKTFIYDYTNGKNKYTSEFLKDYLDGATVITLDEKNKGADFEIVLGEDYLTK
jgi:polyisoprenyl-teichoic acid--peptidoglycan teichoic acid transferase